mmetsp:Transcript_27037/g.40925  ORF Transcript_27037/g.40925 Transcript_27037/m.40925 type:complete len:277 (-) Transcript_27037:1026-1856(-)
MPSWFYQKRQTAVFFFLIFRSTTGLQQPSTVLPDDGISLIRQAASSITSAFQKGVNRQIVKLPLSESMYSDKEEGFVADRAIGWQGGPEETYRFLVPLATELLKEVSCLIVEETGGLVAKVNEQILLDFDGSSLLTAEHPLGPLYDTQAMIQPNTDDYYLKTIRKIEEQFSDTTEKSKRLFLILNPAWKDKSSWGFFGANKAQKIIFDRYETTFAIDQFVVRGQRLSLLRTWGEKWVVFLTPMPYESVQESPKVIGTFAERPTYQEIDALLVSDLS